MTTAYSRRRLLALFALAGGAALAGCDRKSATPDNTPRMSASPPPAKDKPGMPMLVYRDPDCGCCEAWADIARAGGYAVTIENSADMAAVKTRYGVPDALASCHTAVIGGYAIEGHVPMRHVAKLLQLQPRDIRGIAVAGMPRGSPGMEMPDGSSDPFEVMAFGDDGKVSQFRA